MSSLANHNTIMKADIKNLMLLIKNFDEKYELYTGKQVLFFLIWPIGILTFSRIRSFWKPKITCRRIQLKTTRKMQMKFSSATTRTCRLWRIFSRSISGSFTLSIITTTPNIETRTKCRTDAALSTSEGNLQGNSRKKWDQFIDLRVWGSDYDFSKNDPN